MKSPSETIQFHAASLGLFKCLHRLLVDIFASNTFRLEVKADEVLLLRNIGHQLDIVFLLNVKLLLWTVCIFETLLVYLTDIAELVAQP